MGKAATGAFLRHARRSETHRWGFLGSPRPGPAEMQMTPAAGGSRGCGQEAPLPLEGLTTVDPVLSTAFGIWQRLARACLPVPPGPEGLLLGTCLEDTALCSLPPPKAKYTCTGLIGFKVFWKLDFWLLWVFIAVAQAFL